MSSFWDEGDGDGILTGSISYPMKAKVQKSTRGRGRGARGPSPVDHDDRKAASETCSTDLAI